MACHLAKLSSTTCGLITTYAGCFPCPAMYRMTIPLHLHMQKLHIIFCKVSFFCILFLLENIAYIFTYFPAAACYVKCVFKKVSAAIKSKLHFKRHCQVYIRTFIHTIQVFFFRAQLVNALLTTSYNFQEREGFCLMHIGDYSPLGCNMLTACDKYLAKEGDSLRQDSLYLVYIYSVI